MGLDNLTLIGVYISGGISSTVSIASTLLFAVLISPVFTKTYGENILQFLVALAIGCLTGDAIFHLLPHVFLGESSGSANGNHTKSDTPSNKLHDMAVVWQALPIACTIYAFYLIHIIGHSRHAHSHDLTSKKEIGHEDTAYHELVNNDDLDATHNKKKIPVFIWMIIIGDIVHSFSDGVAIGGAYAKSFYGGLGTTVAIIFHEIPHGVGDFAVMVSTGLTKSKSFFLLFIAIIPMYLGMIIGATLAHLMDLTRLIFAITAGMFLFISLVEMLPQILQLKADDKNRWRRQIFHSLGIVIGMVIMIFIAILEGNINK